MVVFQGRGNSVDEYVLSGPLRVVGNKSGERASAWALACLLPGWFQEAYYSSDVSGSCGSPDNDVTRGSLTLDSCGGFAWLPGPGRTNKIAREESSGSSPGNSSGVSRPPVA